MMVFQIYYSVTFEYIRSQYRGESVHNLALWNIMLFMAIVAEHQHDVPGHLGNFGVLKTVLS
jgi:hypothetical protein